MKATIRGTRYDTGAAEEIATGTPSGARASDFDFYRETLYKTEDGDWFVAGKGGPKTKYGSPLHGGGNGPPLGSGKAGGFGGIRPLTSREEVARWMKNHGARRALREHFPAREEDV